MTAYKTAEGLVYYYQPGADILIVFLHGFCEDHSMWKETTVLFPEHGILMVDLPGFGLSDVMPGWTIPDISQKICKLIASVSEEPFILFGHSMGGYIALEMTACTDKIIGLGIVHSHPYADTPEKKENRLKSKLFLEKHGVEIYAKELIPSLFTTHFVSNQPKIIKKLIQNVSTCQIEALTSALDAMRERRDTSHLLQKVLFPVLFLIGQEDKTIPTAYSLRQTHLPQSASIKIYENSAHMVMWEIPDTYGKDLQEFVGFVKQNAY